MRVAVVAGQDKAIAAWVGEKMGVQFQEPLRAFGFVGHDGELFAGSVFNDYYPGGNIEFTHYGPGRFTPEMGEFLIDFVFNQLDCTRVTAKTPRANSSVSKLLLRHGWEFEFVQKRYFGPSKADDAIVYVLHRERACMWIDNHIKGTLQ